ncbi:MAG: hypothetical protein H6852_01320 [Geminicoccaceae bacterium]|jgi:hypothetical protein|nr:hypothetical protein [Geminicoccaceae bacterium]MCB9966259.1 hypothetical protein [Geminicoccaceae bacterium]HRY24367.1 hypothetical protein [Geminicoccaceae bacterium]
MMTEATVGDAPEEAWRRQVRAIVEELPFDDDLSCFVVALETLAEAFALDDESPEDVA